MLLRTASNFVIGGTDQRLGDKQSHKSEPRTKGLCPDWPVGEQLCGDSLKGDSSGGDEPPGGGTGHYQGSLLLGNKLWTLSGKGHCLVSPRAEGLLENVGAAKMCQWS